MKLHALELHRDSVFRVTDKHLYIYDIGLYVFLEKKEPRPKYELTFDLNKAKLFTEEDCTFWINQLAKYDIIVSATYVKESELTKEITSSLFLPYAYAKEYLKQLTNIKENTND